MANVKTGKLAKTDGGVIWTISKDEDEAREQGEVVEQEVVVEQELPPWRRSREAISTEDRLRPHGAPLAMAAMARLSLGVGDSYPSDPAERLPPDSPTIAR